MEDLFSAGVKTLAPLADRMRPRTLDEFIGQKQIVGEGKLLRRAIEADRLTSSIFFGPPGTGKTTLATIVAEKSKAAFEKMNAVTSGVSEVREVLARAEDRQKLYGKTTYLLLDECHRWSKAQSDSILPAIEKGIVRFIGSTTENPMIAMTPAIVSRCRLFRFEPLTDADVIEALRRACADEERGYGRMGVTLDDDAAALIASAASGDVRSALNALEIAVLSTPVGRTGRVHVTREVAADSVQQKPLRMDESLFYDMLSAFCKSLRGSDADAALAWFARLDHAGVDPRIVVRRVIVHASEDVGMANPNAMLAAAAAWQALNAVGMPEARLPIAQAIIAVCESPKSNSVAVAVERAFADAEKGGFESVPAHLRDTHYKGAGQLGSGEGYLYPHDFPGHYVKQTYAPADAAGMPYYQPSDQGGEVEIARRREARERVGCENPTGAKGAGNGKKED